MTSAQATVHLYGAVLDGPSELPTNASPGIGAASVDYDDALHTLHVHIEFTGLVGITIAAHIHSATAIPGIGTVGVAATTPTFFGFPSGVTSGTYDIVMDLGLASSWNPSYVNAHGGTLAGAEMSLADGIAQGRAYVNIHTAAFHGGEIRGFLVQAGCVCNPNCPNFDPCRPACPNSHCNPACPGYDPCNPNCPNFDPCNPACPNSRCYPFCPGYDPCDPNCPSYYPCNPACPNSRCNPLCSGPSPCQPYCPGYDPCNPACINCNDANPATLDVCNNGVCLHLLPGDLNGDGASDGEDVAIFVGCNFGANPQGPGVCTAADINRDGRYDHSDIQALIDRLLNG